MKKQIYLILVVFFVSSFLSGCYNSGSTSHVTSSLETFSPYSKGVNVSQANENLEQIAQIVFGNQMRYMEQPSCPDDRRIKDYKIKNIKIEVIRDSGFIFSVHYSILPATDKFILAGNGSMSENGWINDKFHFVSVLKSDKTYRITSMATGK